MRRTNSCRGIKFILALVVFFVLFRTGQAQENSDYYLDEIVVIGERISDNPYSQTDIKESELKRKSTRSLGNLLQFVPGFSISSGRKNELGLYLRGFRQQEVVILMDGHPIYEPYFGTTDLGQIFLDDIAKVKITKGPASSLYGPNAMGGVINIITKSPKEGGLVRAAAERGNEGYQNWQFSHARQLGKFGYRLNYSRNQSNGFPLSSAFTPTSLQKKGLRNHSNYENNSLSGKLDWQPFKKTHLSFSSGWLKSKKGIPPSTLNFPRFWDFPDWQRLYIDLTAKQQISKTAKVTAKFYGDRFNNTLVAYKDDTFRNPKWTSTYKNQVSGGMLMGSLDSRVFGNWQAVLHVKNDNVHIQDDTGTPWNEYRALTYSAGFQGMFSRSPRFSFLVGTSLDRLQDANRHSITSFNPQAGAVYRVSNPISVRVLMGKKSRFPTLKEWYGSFYGNQLLKPEHTLSAEVGTRFQISRSSLKFTYFYNDVRNLINQKSRNAPFENLDAAILQGVEIENVTSPWKNLTVRWSYTFLSTVDRQTKLQLPFRPKHKWSGQINLTTKNFGNFFIEGQYTGKRQYEDFGEMKTLASYLLLNARIDFRKIYYFRPYFQFLNITDKFYQDEAGFPMPGRELRLGLVFKIG